MRFTKDSKGNIIAISYYRNHAVKGVAKCSPEDNYDEEYGKRLAEARCNVAVNKKRLKGAIDNLKEISEAANELRRKYNKASKYINKICQES